MSNFKKTMIKKQIDWRKINLPHIPNNGKQNGVSKDYILPWEDRLNNFYPHIQDELFNKRTGYLINNKIHTHTGIHNLLSSWALCANMYWPFRNSQGFALLKDYFNKYLNLKIRIIDSMELEFEDSTVKPSVVLGEDDGSRGSGQTSPDLAIIFTTEDEKKGIILIESKFTEHSFYSCSGYSKTKPGKPMNHDKDRCLNTNLITSSNYNECHLNSWGRKYWNLLKDHLDKSKYSQLHKCPMSNCCYQLFRQQALAVALESKYDIVISCVAADSRNQTLKNSAVSIGLKPFPQGWLELFPTTKFQWLTHDTWYEYVKQNNLNGSWTKWINYIGERYY